MRLALIQRRQNEQCNLVLIEIVPVRLTLLRITESRSIVFILHTCTSIEFEGRDTSCTSTSRLNIAVLWAYADHSYTRCLPGHCADISAICACFYSMIVSSGSHLVHVPFKAHRVSKVYKPWVYSASQLRIRTYLALRMPILCLKWKERSEGMNHVQL